MPIFATAINCIDGRAHAPISRYLKKGYGADFVDMITCPGPVRVLSLGEDAGLIRMLYDGVIVSTHKHGSRLIAVVAHHDCAANNLPETQQRIQIRISAQTIKNWPVSATIIGLWINSCWDVEEELCHSNEYEKEFEHELFRSN